MSARTILGIEAMDNELIARIVRSPFPINVHGMSFLKLKPEQLPGMDSADAVLERGKMVRDALRRHQGISGVLDDLGRILPPQVSPLFVQLTPSSAELINWEMLCDGNEVFVALDPRWPIGRIIDPIYAPQRPPSELVTPIRLLAVISALGIKDQHKEWACLRDAVVHARQTGLAVNVKVVVGKRSLLDSITAEIQAGLADVEVAAVEETPSRMIRAIREWAPNILHLFCHGQADALGQSLELATINDDHANAASDPAVTIGSVRISAQELTGLSVSLRNPWLLVLNCCASGKAGVGLHSMASTAVSSGFPTVVAMLEPVDASDAYEFTRAFYPEAFEALATLGQTLSKQPSATIEWAPVLYQVRTAIAQLGNRDTHSAPEWSLPALYVRGLEAQTFVHPLGTSQGLSQHRVDAYKVQVQRMAEWLQTAGQQWDEGKRGAVMAYALAEVPKELWPDADGHFP